MPRVTNPETITKILSVSEQLFIEKGYEKTTTQDIVEMSGVAKGTIFHHFKSKEDILDKVVGKHFERFDQTMSERFSEMAGLSAREKINTIFEKIFDNPETKALTLMSFQIQSPHMFVANLQEWVNKAAPLIAGLLREGVEDGSITTDYPDECAQLLMLFLSVWCDPVILGCGIEELHRRLLFIQHNMRLLGADVVSNDFIEKFMEVQKTFWR